tara:strand:+ start:1459 stop:1569 length:111 start_codon:yes stop_codon:yes gene_type:complete
MVGRVGYTLTTPAMSINIEANEYSSLPLKIIATISQ